MVLLKLIAWFLKNLMFLKIHKSTVVLVLCSFITLNLFSFSLLVVKPFLNILREELYNCITSGSSKIYSSDQCHRSWRQSAAVQYDYSGPKYYRQKQQSP